MTKSKTYIVLWIFSVVVSLMVFSFPSQEIFIYPVAISLIYKFLLGIPGTLLYFKDKPGFTEAKKNIKKLLIPFDILAVLVLQIVLITVLMVITSSNKEIALGTPYAIGFLIGIVLLLISTYLWEIEFFRVVENKVVRIIFSILTPIFLFGPEITMAFLVA